VGKTVDVDGTIVGVSVAPIVGRGVDDTVGSVVKGANVGNNVGYIEG